MALAIEPTYRRKLNSELYSALMDLFPKTPAGDLGFVIHYCRKWSIKTNTNFFDLLASQPPPSPPDKPYFDAQMERLLEDFGPEYRWAAEGAKWRYGLNPEQWEELRGMNGLSMETTKQQTIQTTLEIRIKNGLLLEPMYKYLAVKELGILESERREGPLYDEWRKIAPLVRGWSPAGSKMVWLPMVYVIGKGENERCKLREFKVDLLRAG